MKNDFDWGLVPSLLAALDRGSLLGASKALGRAQPTLGRHIAELERQLGVVLFERTGRGLVPTPAALQLADAARAMQAGADRLARGVAAASVELAGVVRISASQPVACHLLPRALAQIRSALPQVQLEIVVSNAVSNLLRREADIALRMVRPDQATLVARRIATVTVGAYAHRDYLRRRGTPRTPADLLAHDLVGYDRDPTLLRGFSKAGFAVEPRAFAVRTDDLIAYAEAVRAGAGIGFLPDYQARGDADLVRVLPALRLPPLPIWLTVHREIRTSPRIRAVYDLLAVAVPAAL